MDIAAGGVTQVAEQFLKHQDMQHAHSQTSPIGAVVGGKPIHRRVGAQPRQQPLTIGDGAKAEQVLLGVLSIASQAARQPGFARAGELDLELGLEPCLQLLRRSIRDNPRPAGASVESSKPGSLMPTSIIRQN